jgi:ribosome-associated toxin RatA of RatAB toxin-antitoxin module
LLHVVYFTNALANFRTYLMALVEKSVLVEYSAAQMYALVEDVAAYPEFLPWCGGTAILEKEGDITRAAVIIDFRGIRQRFSTENRAHPPQLIEMTLVEGPFRHLDGSWRFKALGEEACKIEFRLHYEFSSKLLEKIVGPVFHFIASTFVDAFVKRARQLYGAR